METSLDNQLTTNMQTFAEVTSRVIQEELKMANQIVNPSDPATPDSVLTFVSVTSDTITIQRSGKNLEIISKSSVSPSTPDTIRYPSSLSSLMFDLERKPAGEPIPYYLNIEIETESDPDHHASTRGDAETVRAFAENEIYLRNVHRLSVTGGAPGSGSSGGSGGSGSGGGNDSGGGSTGGGGDSDSGGSGDTGGNGNGNN
ncbi:MAG: hypothetical protein GVY20_09060 [Bacteroidetes bacterium]|nr:hypothetical protein [Bacteroidota bacterium]